MSFLQKMVAPVAALALAMLLFGAVATAAHAQVPPFTAYGSGLKAGDKVEAFDGGKSCGTATADANADGSSYYERFLAAFERLALEKGLVTPEELDLRTNEYATGLVPRSDEIVWAYGTATAPSGSCGGMAK